MASPRRIFGRHTTEMIAGMTPTRTSVNPSRTSSRAMEMSQAAASPTPPATVWPSMRPTTGVGDAMMARSRSSKPLAPGAALPAAACSERSAPAQKTRPVLVSTTTRTAGSALAASRASSRPPITARLRALRLASSVSVRVATPSATSDRARRAGCRAVRRSWAPTITLTL